VEGAVTAGHYWTVGSIDKSKCLDTGQSALASICNAVPVGGVFQASGTDGQTVSASIDWNLHGGEICATDLPAIPNSSTTATSANTASTIVARDASGNFTAGSITAALTGTASAATTAAQVAGAAPPTSALAVGTNGSNQIAAWMDSTWAGTPSISSCGSGSSQLTSGSTDRRGTITEGATATGCTLTFSVGTHSTATCWLSSSTGLLFTYATTAGSGGGIVVSNAGMFALSGGNLTVGPTVTGNPILNYVCEP
jgi:hypothetical protein